METVKNCFLFQVEIKKKNTEKVVQVRLSDLRQQIELHPTSLQYPLINHHGAIMLKALCHKKLDVFIDVQSAPQHSAFQ